MFTTTKRLCCLVLSFVLLFGQVLVPTASAATDPRLVQIDALLVQVAEIKTAIDTMPISSEVRIMLYKQLQLILVEISKLKTAITDELKLERVIARFNHDTYTANLTYRYASSTRTVNLNLVKDSKITDYGKLMENVNRQIITSVMDVTGYSFNTIVSRNLVLITTPHPISSKVTNIALNSAEAELVSTQASQYSIINSVKVYPWGTVYEYFDDIIGGTRVAINKGNIAKIEVTTDQGVYAVLTYKEPAPENQQAVGYQPSAYATGEATFEVTMPLSTRIANNPKPTTVISRTESGVAPDMMIGIARQTFRGSELYLEDSGYPDKFTTFLGRNTTEAYTSFPVSTKYNCYPAYDLKMMTRGISYLLRNSGFQVDTIENMIEYVTPTHDASFMFVPEGCANVINFFTEPVPVVAPTPTPIISPTPTPTPTPIWPRRCLRGEICELD